MDYHIRTRYALPFEKRFYMLFETWEPDIFHGETSCRQRKGTRSHFEKLRNDRNISAHLIQDVRKELPNTLAWKKKVLVGLLRREALVRTPSSSKLKCWVVLCSHLE